MTDWPDAWLIVPVFNEGQVIGDVVRAARKTFRNIVCVDDGSRDNSVEEIRSARAHLVRHPVNLGQGAAIQTGMGAIGPVAFAPGGDRLYVAAGRRPGVVAFPSLAPVPMDDPP